jgi:hypothetical protein
MGESGPANCLHGHAVVVYWAVFAHIPVTAVLLASIPIRRPSRWAVRRGRVGLVVAVRTVRRKGLSVATQLK